MAVIGPVGPYRVGYRYPWCTEYPYPCTPGTHAPVPARSLVRTWLQHGRGVTRTRSPGFFPSTRALEVSAKTEHSAGLRTSVRTTVRTQ